MAIKLIALDLDGTLLTDTKTVSSANKEAIRWASNQEINVIIATGRCMGIIPPDAFNINDIRYIITSNGAVISDKKIGVIHTEYLPCDAVERVLEAVKDQNFILEVFIGGQCHAPREFVEEINDKVRTGRDPYFYVYHRIAEDDIVDFIKRNKDYIELININFPQGADPRSRISMAQTIESINGLSVTSSLAYNIEIVSARAGKGNALVWLGEHLGIKCEEIMSVGDSQNDMSMPAVSGVCVAMANAHEDVKKRANFVTTSNMEDGVAFGIYTVVESRR